MRGKLQPCSVGLPPAAHHKRGQKRREESRREQDSYDIARWNRVQWKGRCFIDMIRLRPPHSLDRHHASDPARVHHDRASKQASNPCYSARQTEVVDHERQLQSHSIDFMPRTGDCTQTPLSPSRKKIWTMRSGEDNGPPAWSTRVERPSTLDGIKQTYLRHGQSLD